MVNPIMKKGDQGSKSDVFTKYILHEVIPSAGVQGSKQEERLTIVREVEQGTKNPPHGIHLRAHVRCATWRLAFTVIS